MSHLKESESDVRCYKDDNGIDIVEFIDNSGNILTTMNINGNSFPHYKADIHGDAFHPDLLKHIPNIKLREDDVIICSFPKSGTHWVYELTKKLLRGTTDDINTPTLMEQTLELNYGEKLEKLPSPRILVTHRKYKDLPQDIFRSHRITDAVKTRKHRIIYVTRNPKDVLVSYYNYVVNLGEYSGHFKDYFQLFLEGKNNFGCWFDYVMYWEEVIKNRLDGNEILQLNYEQLQKNPHNEVKRLAHFLGVELDERLLHDVIKSCCFRQMEERNCADEPHLYRKGKVGDWKNWFTVAENEQFDLVLSQKMANSDLSFTYS